MWSSLFFPLLFFFSASTSVLFSAVMYIPYLVSGVMESDEGGPHLEQARVSRDWSFWRCCIATTWFSFKNPHPELATHAHSDSVNGRYSQMCVVYLSGLCQNLPRLMNIFSVLRIYRCLTRVENKLYCQWAVFLFSLSPFLNLEYDGFSKVFSFMWMCWVGSW